MLSSTPHFTPYSPAMIYSWWIRGSSCIDRWGLCAKTMRDVTPHQENLRLLMRREKVQCKQRGMRAAWRCAIALAFPPHLYCLHCISVGIGSEKKMCMIEPPEWYQRTCSERMRCGCCQGSPMLIICQRAVA